MGSARTQVHTHTHRVYFSWVGRHLWQVQQLPQITLQKAKAALPLISLSIFPLVLPLFAFPFAFAFASGLAGLQFMLMIMRRANWKVTSADSKGIIRWPNNPRAAAVVILVVWHPSFTFLLVLPFSVSLFCVNGKAQKLIWQPVAWRGCNSDCQCDPLSAC